LVEDRNAFWCVFFVQQARLLISWSKWCPSARVDICLDVNQGGTNRNRCTQRIVIVHTQTYWWTLITWPKPGQS